MGENNINNYFDVIIVGAGFAGSVLAERLANNNKILVIEKRNHIAGNMYDYEKNGVFIHKYGSHIFHTNDKVVVDYLSNFSELLPYQHKVLGIIDGEKIPIPFNLNSLYILFPLEFAKLLENKLINFFKYGEKITILELKKKFKFKKIFILNNSFELNNPRKKLILDIFLGLQDVIFGKILKFF